MSSIQSEQKILMLSAKKLSDDDLETISKCIQVTKFEKKRDWDLSIKDIFARNQCYILDLSDTDQRSYYIHQKSGKGEVNNLKIVFLGASGKKLDVKSVKADFGADYAVKYLPQNAKSANQFIASLFSDHIPEIAGFFAKLWKKIACSC